MLTRWLYVSKSLVDLRDADFQVDTILKVSRQRNDALAITGALLFSGTRFAQFIEGPDAGLRAVQSSIMRDPRHCGIETFPTTSHRERAFDGWALTLIGRSHFAETVIDKMLSQRDDPAGNTQAAKLLRSLC